jgi:hypothetical protein
LSTTEIRRGDLRYPDAPLRARWNWGWLEGCFGNTNISVSDIDAIWERRGHFLVVEVKRLGEKLWDGQLLLLRRLAEKPTFTVWIVRGEKNMPQHVQRVTTDGLDTEEPSSQEDFRSRVAAWFADIEAGRQHAPVEDEGAHISDGKIASALGLLR